MFLMQQQLFIFFIYQQFLCHGSWATRTPPSPSPSYASSPVAASAPLVSSSEATLLTTRIFAAPSSSSQTAQTLKRQIAATAYADAFNEISTSAAAEASSAATETAGPPSETTQGKRTKNRYKIVSVHTNCTRDLFEMQIELNRDFRGILYAKDFPFECRARGTAATNITLRLPASGCGVRSDPRANGNMELSVRVMLQMEQKLRQSSDILRTVRCKLPMTAMGMNVEPTDIVDRMQKNYRNGRMRSFANRTAAASKHLNTVDNSESSNNATQTANTQQQQLHEEKVEEQQTQIPQHQQEPLQHTSITSSTPRVRIWLELGGPDGSGAVEVGQATTLTIRAMVPGTMGVRIVDCAALDGLGESMQQLLDERGCPIDEQVMPALHTRFRPAEEGWSKHFEDDLVEKIFTATFPAFKFPDRERLHVSCGVQLCKGKCPNINCRTAEKLILSGDKHLARIEVFNSLAVTAPQIEVDRLRYDRRYNMSAEEYPPNIRPLPTEGTLCLSVSKLAISFCILGLIFLIAIIVALCSLIRSRRRSAVSQACALTGNRLHRADVCTSMFSSSSESAHSARFGSKLFIPYYPNTLPYGRVY